MSIRVLIAEDHAVVAEALSHLIALEPDMEVVGCVGNGKAAVEACRETRPDIVLMNHTMPILNGTEAAALIGKQAPTTRVVMLSVSSEPTMVYRALQSGAAGYVNKRMSAKEVIEAIRTVYAGERFVSKHLATRLFDQYVAGMPAEDRLGRLSMRERQVLKMLAESKRPVEIAKLLSLSPKTVETYRTRLMAKLEVHDLAGLVRFAIQQGVTSLD
ncbi:MAG: response regulator transcription factor [Burkholderiales bacterium]|nr:response regulator transcription factor [Burkholderiales bacterium]